MTFRVLQRVSFRIPRTTLPANDIVGKGQIVKAELNEHAIGGPRVEYTVRTENGDRHFCVDHELMALR